MFWIVTWWHFQSISKEVIWSQKCLNYMHGLKSAILAVFQNGLGWLGPVSAALKNPSQEFKIALLVRPSKTHNRI